MDEPPPVLSAMLQHTYRVQAKPPFALICERDLSESELTLAQRLLSAHEPSYVAHVYFGVKVSEKGRERLADVLRVRASPSTDAKELGHNFALVFGSRDEGLSWADQFPTRILGDRSSEEVPAWQYWNPSIEAHLAKYPSYAAAELTQIASRLAVVRSSNETPSEIALVNEWVNNGALEIRPGDFAHGRMIGGFDAAPLLATRSEAGLLLFHRNRAYQLTRPELADLRPQFFLYEGEEFRVFEINPITQGIVRRSESIDPKTYPPLLSVIVPVQEGSFELIRLAHAFRAQRYSHFELIFAVSPAASDYTINSLNEAEALLRTRRVRSQRIMAESEAKSGLSELWNLGGYASNGQYLCFLQIALCPDDRFFELLSERRLRSDTLYRSHIVRWSLRSEADFRPQFVKPQFDHYTSKSLEKALLKMPLPLDCQGLVAPRPLFEAVGGIPRSGAPLTDFALLSARQGGAELQVFPGRLAEIVT